MQQGSKNLRLDVVALRAMARTIQPHPKVVRKPKLKQGGDWNVKVSDDVLRAALVRRLQGERCKDLAAELNVTPTQFSKWTVGESRGKILREAEEIYHGLVTA